MGLVQSAAGEVKGQVLEMQAKQREMQMAINIAQTRDLVQYVAGVWTGVAGVAILATAKHRAFPRPMAIPLIVLPLIGAYQADMAYSTKLRRVVQEAEHILEHERHLMIPPKQAPFAHLYEDEKAALDETALAKTGRVGSYWPSFVRAALEGDSSSSSSK